jgi:hypothetical protein
MILQFSLFYFLLAKKMEIAQEDRDEFALMTMRSSFYPGYFVPETSYKPTVLDYVAVAATACIVDHAIALGLVRHGIKNPKLMKQPSLVAHFEFASWKKPTLWRKICWAFRVMSSSYGTERHQERNLIAWLMIETGRGRSRICNLAIWIWRRKFQSQYPQGIQYLISSLFSPSHPLVKYWSS